MTDGFFDLWVMHADGGGQRKLTTLPLNEVGGVYSPDDALIAFMGNNGGNRDIRVMRADGTGIVNVTSGWCLDASTGAGCTLSEEIMPAWTPDGRIVFASTRSGSPQLWIMDANGSNARQVTHLAGVNGHPSVSANGKTHRVQPRWLPRDSAARRHQRASSHRHRGLRHGVSLLKAPLAPSGCAVAARGCRLLATRASLCCRPRR